MATITFFTKIGCATSLKQIDFLRQSGHEVSVQDLMSHQWESEELRSFFGNMPVHQWFNPNAPRIKSGEIDPTSYDDITALGMMKEDALLIRRPLMESGHQRMCGFDQAKVDTWIGLDPSCDPAFSGVDIQSCSVKDSTSKDLYREGCP